jgi:hypothetical protein
VAKKSIILALIIVLCSCAAQLPPKIVEYPEFIPVQVAWFSDPNHFTVSAGTAFLGKDGIFGIVKEDSLVFTEDEFSRYMRSIYREGVADGLQKLALDRMFPTEDYQ